MFFHYLCNIEWFIYPENENLQSNEFDRAALRHIGKASSSTLLIGHNADRRIYQADARQR